MKNLFTLMTVAVFSVTTVFSQCTETPANRVLLVGDSWAAFMNADQTITHALRNAGHSDKKYTTSFVIAENGADTWDFLDQEKQTEIQNLIDANPEIDIVHLSIGGNDLLGEYHVSWDQERIDSLQIEVGNRLTEIIEFLKNTRPGIRVFWPGYAYPNFGEIISDLGGAASIHPFFSTWDEMGQPTFIQLNQILNDYSDTLALQAADDPYLDFVPAQGILQHDFGQSQPLGIAPGGTYE
ncbi:MAG: GDSL-type esterase/lipase family protein, partial [Flavobacteriales bacterium]|nr:GDSL-type esterase/lipase family protein [Flavobacteriales bacterium]